MNLTWFYDFTDELWRAARPVRMGFGDTMPAVQSGDDDADEGADEDDAIVEGLSDDDDAIPPDDLESFDSADDAREAEAREIDSKVQKATEQVQDWIDDLHDGHNDTGNNPFFNLVDADTYAEASEALDEMFHVIRSSYEEVMQQGLKEHSESVQDLATLLAEDLAAVTSPEQFSELTSPEQLSATAKGLFAGITIRLKNDPHANVSSQMVELNGILDSFGDDGQRDALVMRMISDSSLPTNRNGSWSVPSQDGSEKGTLTYNEGRLRYVPPAPSTGEEASPPSEEVPEAEEPASSPAPTEPPAAEPVTDPETTPEASAPAPRLTEAYEAPAGYRILDAATEVNGKYLKDIAAANGLNEDQLIQFNVENPKSPKFHVRTTKLEDGVTTSPKFCLENDIVLVPVAPVEGTPTTEEEEAAATAEAAAEEEPAAEEPAAEEPAPAEHPLPGERLDDLEGNRAYREGLAKHIQDTFPGVAVTADDIKIYTADRAPDNKPRQARMTVTLTFKGKTMLFEGIAAPSNIDDPVKAAETAILRRLDDLTRGTFREESRTERTEAREAAAEEREAKDERAEALKADLVKNIDQRYPEFAGQITPENIHVFHSNFVDGRPQNARVVLSVTLNGVPVKFAREAAASDPQYPGKPDLAAGRDVILKLLPEYRHAKRDKERSDRALTEYFNEILPKIETEGKALLENVKSKMGKGESVSKEVSALNTLFKPLSGHSEEFIDLLTGWGFIINTSYDRSDSESLLASLPIDQGGHYLLEVFFSDPPLIYESSESFWRNNQEEITAFVPQMASHIKTQMDHHGDKTMPDKSDKFAFTAFVQEDLNMFFEAISDPHVLQQYLDAMGMTATTTPGRSTGTLEMSLGEHFSLSYEPNLKKWTAYIQE